MDVVGLAAVILLFGGGTLALLAFSPIGRALGARILGRASPVLDDDDVKKELEQIRGQVAALAGLGEEVELLRDQVAELAERVDFAERLLAKQRQQALPKPGA